jgi:hypothetical protein
LWCPHCEQPLRVRPDELAAFRAGGRFTRQCRRKIEPTAELQGPGLIRKGANFAGAAAKHVLTGSRRATQDEIDARQAICIACPSKLYQPDPTSPGTGTCTHPSCGCPITRQSRWKSKLSWAESKCPMEHWGAIDDRS